MACKGSQDVHEFCTAHLTVNAFTYTWPTTHFLSLAKSETISTFCHQAAPKSWAVFWKIQGFFWQKEQSLDFLLLQGHRGRSKVYVSLTWVLSYIPVGWAVCFPKCGMGQDFIFPAGLLFCLFGCSFFLKTQTFSEKKFNCLYQEIWAMHTAKCWCLLDSIHWSLCTHSSVLLCFSSGFFT